MKLFKEFYVRRQRKNGLQSVCIECAKEMSRDIFSPKGKGRIYQRNWSRRKRFQEPNYFKNKVLKKSYGIGLDEYNSILSEQNGVCKICFGPPLGRGSYHVDHDHKTKKIRGLLCHKCNVALGMVQDRIDLLHKLIAYLVKNSE